VKLGFKVLDHPAYSPDLAPPYYHLPGPLKDASRARPFTSDEVKEAVHESKDIFSAVIQKRVEGWNKCIEKHGDYTENGYNCKVSAIVEI
jgi:hypothetical protein